mgnify:FL=1
MLKKFTKETMEEYEIIHSSGTTNMFDYFNVIKIAKKVGLKVLAKLTRDDYKELLMNFNILMKKYDIKQRRKED